LSQIKQQLHKYGTPNFKASMQRAVEAIQIESWFFVSLDDQIILELSFGLGFTIFYTFL